MERDPVRYVWRAAPRLHLLGFAGIVMALPVAWLGLSLIRIALDDVLGGRAFQGGHATAPFLRLAIELPERMMEHPLVLVPGIMLDRTGFATATAASLLAVCIMAALLGFAGAALRAAISERAVTALRRGVVDAVVTARPAAAEDARRATTLAGDGIAREGGLLGSALLLPAAAGAALALSLVYVALADLRLAAALLLATVLLLIVWPRRIRAAGKLGDTRLTRGAALRRALTDLVRRLPAMRAHATGALERERLSASLSRSEASSRPEERRAAALAGLLILATMLVPLGLLATGVVLGASRGITAGEAAAAAAASILALLALERLMGWRTAMQQARVIFEEAAHVLGRLRSRASQAGTLDLPRSGPVVAEGLSASDPLSGSRISGVDAAFDFPAHVALVGEPGSGARVFAALLGGRLEPSGGTLTWGGVDLDEVAPAQRAARIAYAGGPPVLISGSLRANILYGCRDAEAGDIETRLAEAAITVGLDRLAEANGLAATIDPHREAKLAASVVEARAAVRAALAAKGLEALVEPFDPARYNGHASIGENILFGVPVGDTFRDDSLPVHSFVRAILDAEGLTRPLIDMGAAIAASMVEMFLDLPERSPLFERFSFFQASERGYFEDLIQRRGRKGRDGDSGRDRERLMGLAFRYSEHRHRLALLDGALESKILAARSAFARQLPPALKSSIEFFDPARLCAAASLQDNLLFGRIAQDRAGAEREVLGIVRQVLEEHGLRRDLFRIGLETRIDPRGGGLTSAEAAAIDVARCLVRGPDAIVIEHALDGLASADADAFCERLLAALGSRGLVLVRPDLPPAVAARFDSVLRFSRGAEARVEQRRG
jgi:ABC-type multidrug transport system fused ATPase/permease subunit